MPGRQLHSIYIFAIMFYTSQLGKRRLRMSLSTSIGKYQYVYGAGNAPNRSIEFYGNNEKIWGEVFRKTQNCWEKIGEVTEGQMTKEGASTTEKMRIMMKARQELTKA